MTIKTSPPKTDNKRHSYAQAKAKMLRRIVGLNTAPIPLEEILINQKISVSYVFDLQEMICLKYDDRNIIMFPPSSDRNRDRWYLAQGIGHFCLHHFEVYDANRIISGIPLETTTEYQLKKLQKEASIFASEILLPLNLFKRYITLNADIDHIAEQVSNLIEIFQVPEDVIYNRLGQVGRRG